MPKKKSMRLTEEEIMFLDKIVDVNLSLNDVVDERASIMAGIGGVIMVISLGQLFNSSGLASAGFFTIVSTGLITILLSVGVIRPKELKARRKNLMYYGGFSHLKLEEYRKKLKKAISTKENIFDQYSKEVHDLSQELSARFRLIKAIGDILVAGLIIGFGLVLLSLFL
jgi:hypothetical protein